MSRNQFKVEKFNHKCSVGDSADIPLTELDGLTPISTAYIASSTSMNFTSLFGASDNYMLRVSAHLYMKAAKSVTATIRSDDGSKWILNGTVLGSTNYHGGTKTITFNFVAGDNYITGLYSEISGGDEFLLSPSVNFSSIGMLNSEEPISSLRTNLNAILAEKTEKIIPENIKKGVTILDVTGELDTTFEGHSDYSVCNNLAALILDGTELISDPYITIVLDVTNNDSVKVEDNTLMIEEVTE